MFRNLFKPRPVDRVTETPPLSHTVGLIIRLLEMNANEWVERRADLGYFDFIIKHPTRVEVKCYDNYGRSMTVEVDGLELKLSPHENKAVDEAATKLIKAWREEERHALEAARNMKISAAEDRIALALFGRNEA
jgi:hypothetical protein